MSEVTQEQDRNEEASVKEMSGTKSLSDDDDIPQGRQKTADDAPGGEIGICASKKEYKDTSNWAWFTLDDLAKTELSSASDFLTSVEHRTPSRGELATSSRGNSGGDVVNIDWQMEISPIARSRESGESGVIMSIETSDPTSNGDSSNEETPTRSDRSTLDGLNTRKPETTPIASPTPYSKSNYEEEALRSPREDVNKLIAETISSISNAAIEIIAETMCSISNAAIEETLWQDHTTQHQEDGPIGLNNGPSRSTDPTDEHSNSVTTLRYSEVSKSTSNVEDDGFLKAVEIKTETSIENTSYVKHSAFQGENISGQDQSQSPQENSPSRSQADFSTSIDRRGSYDEVKSRSISLLDAAPVDPLQQIRDLSSAKKLVDESSVIFIESIRGAAHRRKMAMSRSRDSLAVMEREQLLSIAASKKESEAAKESSSEPTAHPKAPQSTMEEYKPFKARPLPSTTGTKGMGGLVGVPKVESKPKTTPFSPLLGKRRQEKIHIKALEKPKEKSGSTSSQASSGQKYQDPNSRIVRSAPSLYGDSNTLVSFKARPVPASTGVKGQGGQIGVPKVPKRPVTVPFSPCLGPKRRNKDSSRPASSSEVSRSFDWTNLVSDFLANSFSFILFLQVTTTRQRDLQERTLRNTADANRNSSEYRVSFDTKAASPMAASSPLLGLQLLDTPEPTNDENDENDTPRHAQIKAYEPHSTIRARKREEFDAMRDEIQQRKMEEEHKHRLLEIKRMHKELSKLRQDLR
jgi:hypothetical protein